MRQKLIYFSIIILVLNSKTSYNQYTGKFLELSSVVTSSSTYTARDYITLNPGFLTVPSITADFTIDESLLYDVEVQSPVNPDTREINTYLPVGATAGVFDVTATGAATYQIPIFVSPGTAGVQPQIALVYSSQGGNSMLGVGWGLSGLSAITRIGKTIFNDGEKAGVNLDSEDRFALDGNRLVCVSGTYGASPSVYRTETDAFLRVTAYGTAGTGPSYFIAETKDGMTLTYGGTSDSRIEAPEESTSLMWRLNKAEDANGNYIEYEHDETNGESYIAQINYTKNTTAGIDNYNSIKFFYEYRLDKNTVYVAGSAIPQTRLLRKIKCESENNIVREYYFTYSMDRYTHLNEIIEKGEDGTPFNSTIVSWGSATSQVATANSFDNDEPNRFCVV